MLINDQTIPVATEADLVNASRMLIQTPSGTKAGPGDIFSPRSSQKNSVINLFAISSSLPAGISDGDYYYHTGYKTELQHRVGGSGVSIKLTKDGGVFLYNKVPYKFNGTELVVSPNAGGMRVDTIGLNVGKCVRTGNTVGATLNLTYEADANWSCIVRKVDKGDVFAFRIASRNTSSNYQFCCFTDTNLVIKSFDYDYVSSLTTFAQNSLEDIGSGNYLVSMVAPCDGYLVCNGSNTNFGTLTRWYTSSVHEMDEKLNTAYSTALSADGKADTALSRSTVDVYADVTDVSSSATITRGYYMRIGGQIQASAGFMMIEFATSTFDTIKFNGRFNKATASMIQLDENDVVLEYYDLDASGSFEIIHSINSSAARIVFNCTSSAFTAYMMNVQKEPVNEYAHALGVEVEKIAKGIGNPSKFYKGHDFGLVPMGKYKGNLTDYTWGGASTQYSEILTKYDELLVNNYSYKESIGTASNGDTMYVYKFTPPVVSYPSGYSKGIPTIMIICAQHGFEKGSTFGVWHFLKDVIENSESDELLRYIRRNVNLYVVPVANPWGFNTNNYWNYNKVNLNRNWDVPNWQYSYDADNPRYNSGDAPFDQPETANIRDFIQAHLGELDFVIDHHTNGGSNVSTLDNLNWVDTTTCGDDDDEYYNRIKGIAVTHAQNVSSIIPEIADSSLTGITGTEGEETRCAKITYASPFPTTGFADAYCITQGIISNTLEGFAGFPNGERYCDEEKRAMSVIIGSWLQYVLYWLGR